MSRRNADPARSPALARAPSAALTARGLHVAVPAALLESGLIVNRDGEVALASDARRRLVADALSDAFAADCDRRW